MAGLPGAAAELLFPGRVKRGGERAAKELDRRSPGWVETAGKLVAGSACFTPSLQRLCLLVGHRPLKDPTPLLRRLENSADDPEPRFWLLVALSGTDTAAVRRGWLLALSRASSVPSLVSTRVVWFALVRALLGGWLAWTEFRDALITGQALAAVSKGGSYRGALARVWPVGASDLREMVSPGRL